MPKEYEVIAHNGMEHVNAFVVRLQERVAHMHRELELGYVLEGAITLRTQQQTVLLQAGEMYLVNRMEPHEFSSAGGGALLLAIQFSPKLTQGFQKPGTHYRYRGNPNLTRALDAQPQVCRAICQACVELTYSFLRRQPNDEFRCFSLSATLIYRLHQALSWDLLDYGDYSAMKQRANRMMGILDYVDQNFQRKLLLSEIAQRENLSLCYLSHFFKNTLGMTFQEYLNHRRFEYACNLLLTTDRTILDISLASGYSDVRYFHQAFVAQYGCAPKEYRRSRKTPATQHQQLQTNTQSFYAPSQALEVLEELRNAMEGEWVQI